QTLGRPAAAPVQSTTASPGTPEPPQEGRMGKVLPRATPTCKQSIITAHPAAARPIPDGSNGRDSGKSAGRCASYPFAALRSLRALTLRGCGAPRTTRG